MPKWKEKEYYCNRDLDLYDSAECENLATQAAKGRHLVIKSKESKKEAIAIELKEDNYQAWLAASDLSYLLPVNTAYQATNFSRDEIVTRIPQVIAYTEAARQKENYYLWGGTIGPNYDCSGLIQAAFASVGIWLPRDSYQQAEFTKKITVSELQRGDLIFFGTSKVDHVALYLGNNYYIHSSGKAMGHNGIAIDTLSVEVNGDAISRAYAERLWGFGRVMSSVV